MELNAIKELMEKLKIPLNRAKREALINGCANAPSRRSSAM